VQYTNNGKLPASLYYALTHDTYEKAEGCISVTELIDAPRQRILLQRHSDETVEDVSGGIFSLVGNGVHLILSAYNKGTTEQRYYAYITDKTRLSGTPDLFEDDTLFDYKTTSTWTHIFGIKDSWVKQMNVYRWLLRRNYVIINNLVIVAIFRDWTESNVDRKPGYPPFPATTYPVKTWLMSDTEDYIMQRTVMHESAEQLPDDQLPECDSDERWQKQAVYAVNYGNRTKAERLLDSVEEAESWISRQSQDKSKYTIVKRPEEWKRCEKYCSASPFCNQYKKFCELERKS